MKRPSDWQAREQGRDPHYSYIVQAPAGSGKTELLTQRMLGLLARVENPEEVVAITFTRKAAAEMSHRLLGHLQAAASNNDEWNDNGELQEHEQISRKLALAVLENDAEQGWNLLEQPSRLRIRTIDSLCSELARQLPVLSGLGGGHQIAVDADSLYRKAAMRTMAVIEDDNDELQADVIRVL
ncbi:MAG: UvrD-helicase domain-containing protein, partial [Proteobacteria bacterium]|nr:UvrD-helicase domain-containing protein [Pseudomonadota bacterium]